MKKQKRKYNWEDVYFYALSLISSLGKALQG